MADATVRMDDEDDDERPEKGSKAARGLEDRLLKSRTLALFEPITPRSSRRLVTGLLVLEAEDAKAPVTVLVNSPGGSVDDGFAIYDTMRFLRCPVRIVCVGLAASAANIVLLGAPKGSRFSLPNTRILLHQPSGGFQGQASDIERHAQDIIKLKRRLNEIYVKHTGRDLETIETTLDRDHFMTATEAKDFGLIDNVITSREAMEAAVVKQGG